MLIRTVSEPYLVKSAVRLRIGSGSIRVSPYNVPRHVKIMLTPGVERRHSAVFKHDAPIKEFDDVERSILTVTSILQRMGRQHSPTTTNPSEI